MAYTKQNYQPGDVLTAEQMNKIQDAVIVNEGNIEGHIENKNNPHGVTPAQIGAVNKNGDTMTGTLYRQGGAGAVGVAFGTAAKPENVSIISVYDGTEKNRFSFRQYGSNGNRENFNLPDTTAPEKNINYDILTTKAPVSVAQGGTGATDAATARANLGVAPAGLVQGSPTFASTTEFETWLKELFNSLPTKSVSTYQVAFSTGDSPFYGGGQATLTIYKQLAAYGAIKVIRYYENQVVAEFNRQIFNNSWSGWDWVSPPMALGAEYPTTERWNGKKVYTKLVNIGALPNTTGKYIEGGLLPMGITVITAYGVGIGEKHSVVVPTRTIHLSVDGEWGTIYISTDSDYSNYTGYIVVKYIKN